MSYERLTTVDKDGHIDITGIWDVDMRREDERKYHAAINRLVELEDMIANNVLMQVPLPLNSKVFVIVGNKSIKEAVIIKYEFGLSGKYAEVMWYEGDRKMVMYVGIDELNETEEEAEAKLKERGSQR